MLLFSRSLVCGAILWILAGVISYLRTGKFRDHFAFSVRNYYLLASVFVVGVIFDSFKSHSLNHFIIFLIFCGAGVLGETIFALWWHAYYEEKLWSYRVQTLVHSYTSLLNFIPWGMGGLLYLKILAAFAPTQDLSAFRLSTLFESGVSFYLVFWTVFLIGLSVQILLKVSFSRKKAVHSKFTQPTLFNYIFFLLPFLLALAVTSSLYGLVMLKMALLFGLIAAFAEYLFGKATEFFISKKLWVYNYYAFDKGHFTPLALPVFSLGGFYFWTIALIVQQLLVSR